jgi:hypothetical protein
LIPEPWLRGPLQDVNPLLAPVLRALQQAQEDLEKFCSRCTDEEIWTRPYGLAPLGFHLRHIAGSLDRLTTYLEGGQLTESQFAFLHSEMDAGGTRPELLCLVADAIARASQVVTGLDPDSLTASRTVGRKNFPTTVIGLSIHLAEHSQRHVGQAITVCNLLLALRQLKYSA